MMMTRTFLLPNTIALLIANIVSELLESDENKLDNGVRYTDAIQLMPALAEVWSKAEGETATARHPGTKDGGCMIQMADFVNATWDSAYMDAEHEAERAGYRLEVDVVWEMAQMRAAAVRQFSAANSNPVIDTQLLGNMTAKSFLVLLVPLAMAEEADSREAHMKSLKKQTVVLQPVLEKEPV